MKAQQDALIRVGSLMSNVAFNLGQSAGPQRVDDNTRATLRKLCGDWDNALRELRAAQKKRKVRKP